jgi:LPXTG-motif cell wall-anchored protein
MDVNLLIALGIIALLLLIGGLLIVRRRRSDHLAQRFGPEYERTVERMGSRGKAEADLLAREKRVSKLAIVPLPPAEAERFRSDWQVLQGRFVDNPRSAVAEADLLVRDLMTRRGYPMGDFESRAADISVDHPLVVEHYRAGHAIALREREGGADTEALRQALVHYRSLFSELLEVAPEPAPRAAEERRAEEPRRRGFLRPDRAMAREEPAPGEREPRRER